MKRFVISAVGLMPLLWGLTAGGAAVAEPPRHGMHHQHGMRDMPQQGAAGHPGCEHHMRHHGSEERGSAHERHAHHGGGDSSAAAWKQTLSGDQRTQIDALRVSHRKLVAPLRAKMHAVKTELAVLATADAPDSAAIQGKLDELLAMKKQVMTQRYEHVAAVRKILTPEQRLAFDTMVLNKAKHRGRHAHH